VAILGFNGVGQYTLNSGGHSVSVGVSRNGEDQGAQYVAGDPCNPETNGFYSNGTLVMSDQMKTGEGDPADFGLEDPGPPGFVAYYATVRNTTPAHYGTCTFSLQGGGFS
jgi:hypothetical protein